MNAKEQASLLAHLSAARERVAELEARVEKARATLDAFFYSSAYVGTRAYEVVSKALFELAGEEA